MYNVDTNQRIQRGPLPVSDETTITWLGFSEYGVPAFYDDTGLVHILNHYRRIDQGQWVPILDTSVIESEADTSPIYWPVGLTDEVLTCVKCRVRVNRN
jgi:chromosome transmission fidelity protein 4